MGNPVDLSGSTSNLSVASDPLTPGQLTPDSLDLMGGFRHPPVSRGCSNEIPETIEEESESRRESLAELRRESLEKMHKLSLHKQFETLADIAQSSEESANSFLINCDSVKPGGSSDADLTHVESDGVMCNRVDRHADIVRNASNMSLTDDNSLSESSMSMTSISNNTSGTRKVQPLKSDSFEKAVGFLLESTVKKNQQSRKRVNFNYV